MYCECLFYWSLNCRNIGSRFEDLLLWWYHLEFYVLRLTTHSCFTWYKGLLIYWNTEGNPNSVNQRIDHLWYCSVCRLLSTNICVPETPPRPSTDAGLTDRKRCRVALYWKPKRVTLEVMKRMEKKSLIQTTNTRAYLVTPIIMVLQIETMHYSILCWATYYVFDFLVLFSLFNEFMATLLSLVVKCNS